MGRFPPVVTVCEFSSLATCYAESNGRVRLRADIDLTLLTLQSQLRPCNETSENQAS
jgi:hypothetical protein